MPRTKRVSTYEKFRRQYRGQPKKGEIEVGKEAVDRTVEKRTFEYFDQPTRGERFHIFREKGEELTGRLVSHGIANVRRNSSYAIELDSGEVVEVFANRKLHKQLADCFQQCIRIVYIGREHNNWGHAAKVYRVYKEKTGSYSGPGSGELAKKTKAKIKTRKGDDGK